MAQLKRGARQSLEYFYADLDDIIENAHNPGAVRALAMKCKARMREEIEPRLQRAAPTVEEQIRELRDRVERLEREKIIVMSQREDL